MAAPVPNLREERRLLREGGHRYLAGMDEVGRGALAGPVSVGVVVVDLATRTAPAGVRDSKLLSPAARQALAPRLQRWGVARAVGHAEPWEIDRVGIIAALRLAARRALQALPVRPDCVLLDGSHDWLSPPAMPIPQPGLFDLAPQHQPVAAAAGGGLSLDHGLRVETGPHPQVVTRVKADLRCAAVASASVIAKVERDAIMVARSGDHPAFGWHENKGYAAPEHIAALQRLGPCTQHRCSWQLPGVATRVSPGLDHPVLLPE